MMTVNEWDILREAQQSIPVNLHALARQLGIEVRHTPLDDELSGYIHKDDGRWRIVVNALHADTRQRFTLAHEIGHYMLHRHHMAHGTNDTRQYRPRTDSEFYSSAIERRHEREANQFAAGLLMPKNLVATARRETGVNDPSRLARLFGVSPAAMEIRMDNLGRRGQL
jgi:Zn-dependent peptidase ImmA (M78 family)